MAVEFQYSVTVMTVMAFIEMTLIDIALSPKWQMAKPRPTRVSVMSIVIQIWVLTKFEKEQYKRVM